MANVSTLCHLEHIFHSNPRCISSHSDRRHNTQLNDANHDDNQHNDTHHNDIQHTGLNCDTQYK